MLTFAGDVYLWLTHRKLSVLIFAFGIIATGLFTTVVNFNADRDRTKIMKLGTDTEAVVYRKFYSGRGEGDPRIVVRFRASELTHEVFIPVSDTFEPVMNRPKNGTPTSTVRYLRSDPDQATFPAMPSPHPRRIVYGLIILVIGLGLGWIGWHMESD